jgi:SpoVK/Ycf46/Vps4 family AAA+-type ATPase
MSYTDETPTPQPHSMSPDDIDNWINSDTDGEEDEEEDEKVDYIQWLKRGANQFFPEGKLPTVKKLKAGIYDIKYSRQHNSYFTSRKHVSLDELFILPEPTQENVLRDIRTFWEREDWFKKYKFVYKRGILLYGPAGSGKSSIINLIVHEIVKKFNGIVFYLHESDELSQFMNFVPEIFKQIEPNRKVLCIIEDLDGFVQHRETESKLLNLLDGMNQINNIVFIASTNYPEQLKERITNRPSRFDRRYFIVNPNEELRKFYFEKKINDEDLKTIDIKKWAKETDGLAFAHLSEIIKSVFALGNTFEETLAIMKEMKEKINSHDFDKKGKRGAVGFNNR